MQPRPPANKKLMVDPRPPKLKNPLKPVMPKPKNFRELVITPDKPGVPKPRIISKGGIGNKEVNPIYRNQGF